MRILKVTQAYYPFLDKGGPTVKVPTIARKLAGRGHRITVLTADLGFEAGRAPSAIVERSPWGWRAEQDGVEAIYLRGRPLYRALTVNPGVVGFCRQFLEGFELVHIYGLYDLLGPTVAFFCRRRAIPYVVEPMGMVRAIDRSFRLKHFWHALFGNEFLRNAAALIATSRQEQQELLADGFSKERIVLRYNGLDLEEFKPLPPRGAFRSELGIAPDEPVILFLGRLIPRKGVDLLISAFARVCSGNGKLVVAGPEAEPGYLDVLRRQARLCGVEEQVIFTGPLYAERKKAAMVDSDIFALPSSYENFANSVGEAIACGTPVIVTQNCGISEFVEGQVGLVIPRDLDALAQAIEKLLQDRTLHQQCKAACSSVGAALAWDRVLVPLENLYEQLQQSNERHHTKTFYDLHPFDWTERYAPQEVRAALSPLLLQLLDELGEDSLILDVGCGTGRVMSYLCHRNLRCVGIDRSRHSVGVMASRLGRPGVVADNCCLPVRDATADVIVSDGVLHHTDDPYRAFVENCRVLRTGGRFYLAVYRPGGRYEFLYRYPGQILRGALRYSPSRFLVHGVALPLYYAVHLLKTRGRITWRGATNLFYDYFASPHVAFLSRATIEEWCRNNEMRVLTYDLNWRRNVHSFVLQKVERGARN